MPTHSARTASAALALMLAAGSAWADELHVPAQYPTIQAAINAAIDGDEIVIAPGTYRELLDGRNKSLTYTGAGMGLTVLSGDLDEDGVPDGTVLTINDTTATTYPTLTMRDLTVREGTRGVQVSRAGDTTILRCAILSCSSNSSVSTPAFEIIASPSDKPGQALTIDGCAFVDNRVPIKSSYITQVSIRNTMILQNKQSTTLDECGDITLDSSVVSENFAIGLRVTDCTSVTVSNSNFFGNRGSASEIITTNTVEIYDSNFESNGGSNSRDSYAGGAVYTSYCSQLRIERCVFLDNHAIVGGAIFSRNAAT